MKIKASPKFSSWFQPRLRRRRGWEWNERRISIWIFNVRIIIRFTNMKHRSR